MPTRNSHSSPRPKRRLHPSGKVTEVKPNREERAIRLAYETGRNDERYRATSYLSQADGIGSGVEAADHLRRGKHQP